MAIMEKNISYKICIPLCEIIQLVTKSIGACLSVAIKNIYKIPRTWIVKTPITEMRKTLKKSVFPLSKVPAKNIAGRNASI